MTNNRSATARLIIRIFVVDLIPGFAATTITTKEFPTSPRIPIIPKNIGTTTTTILSTWCRSKLYSKSSKSFWVSLYELFEKFLAILSKVSISWNIVYHIHRSLKLYHSRSWNCISEFLITLVHIITNGLVASFNSIFSYTSVSF